MTVPFNLMGDYVVTRGQRGAYTGRSDPAFADMTLADFRHALDWFSTYFDTTIREMPSGGSVFAVKISSPREQMIYGCELFTPVAVDRGFPSNSSVSPISQALGFPIRVCRLDPDDLERTVGESDETREEGEKWTNPYAQGVMTEIDLESEARGYVFPGMGY
ncbi:hypothetical protein BJY01DRAFT_250921 [Aspergillus pseudoustus]|uniref:Uncharacterized protein n=1 Tax=Aspergillus pseudoustus TaxID=1810923 RepID=A0ABR4JEU1_9EURO